MKLSLEEFRATRTEMTGAELAIASGDAAFDDNPDAEMLVYGGTFWIERQPDGRYWLQLECDEFTADEPAELEERLHEWASEDGWIE